MARSKPKPCTIQDCPYPKKAGHPKWCEWHWLLRQPAGIASEASVRRLRQAKGTNGFIEQKRVPAEDWPAGMRWCAGCQSFVPLFYVTGSRCKGCASRAAHASHIKRAYNLDPETYEALLAFQGGRCYVCGQVPRSQRLAVDHDHETGVVRGLLCANDEFGCNVSLRRILGNPAAARRAAEYAEKPPLDRMRDGDPRPVYTDQRVRKPSATMESLQRAVQARRETDRQEPAVPPGGPTSPPAVHWTQDPDWAF